jgi:hypothetical protein
MWLRPAHRPWASPSEGAVGPQGRFPGQSQRSLLGEPCRQRTRTPRAGEALPAGRLRTCPVRLIEHRGGHSRGSLAGQRDHRIAAMCSAGCRRCSLMRWEQTCPHPDAGEHDSPPWPLPPDDALAPVLEGPPLSRLLRRALRTVGRGLLGLAAHGVMFLSRGETRATHRTSGCPWQGGRRRDLAHGWSAADARSLAGPGCASGRAARATEATRATLGARGCRSRCAFRCLCQHVGLRGTSACRAGPRATQGRRLGDRGDTPRIRCGGSAAPVARSSPTCRLGWGDTQAPDLTLDFRVRRLYRPCRPDRGGSRHFRVKGFLLMKGRP